MEKTIEKIVEEIIRIFKEYVDKGLFNVNFIGPQREYYSGGRCHSRVLGILAKTFQSIGYIVDIERSIKFNDPYKPPGRKRAMHQYRPDITIINEHDRIVGIVEYETIDASEEHLFQKIEYFNYAIPSNFDIRFIIFIPTLTRLKSSPQSWIKLDRSVYDRPISKKLEELSKKHPHIHVTVSYTHLTLPTN